MIHAINENTSNRNTVWTQGIFREKTVIHWLHLDKKKKKKNMWSLLVWRSKATVHLSNSCCAHSLRRFCSRASRSASASIWAAWASPFFAPGAAKAPPATGRAASARTKLLQVYRKAQESRTSGSRKGFPYSTARRTW